jgi:hypothetical protein
VPIPGYTGIKIGNKEMPMTRKQSLEALLRKLKEAEEVYNPNGQFTPAVGSDPILVALERAIEEVEYVLCGMPTS